MVHIAKTHTIRRERQGLSISRDAVPNSKSVHSGRDRPRWVGVKTFEDAAMDGRNA